MSYQRNSWPDVFLILGILALVLALILILSATASGQTIREVDFISEGYWTVSTPDTTYRHLTEREALQRATNLAIDGVSPEDIHIAPYSIRLNASYTATPRDTVFMYASDPWLRDVRYQIQQDTLEGFQIEISGYTDADEIRYASKCIGYDSSMVAIDERIAFTMRPDSTGFVRGLSDRYYCYKQNALLTYWLTATGPIKSVIERRFIDVAHVLSID